MRARIITGGVLLVALFGASWLVTWEGACALLIGWISFLGRVAPRMSVYWPSVVVGVAAFVLLFVGVHLFARTLPRAVTVDRNATDGVAGRPWKFRWTACFVLIVVIAFAAGVSMIGIVHQIGWLATSEKPLLGEAIERYGGADARRNMGEIGLGFLNHESARKRLPSAKGRYGSGGDANFSWETQILPYAWFYFPEKLDLEKPWNDPANARNFKCINPILINPDFRTPELEDKDGFGLDHYSANEKVITDAPGLTLDEIKDGQSNTIMFGEVSAGFSPWGKPGNVRDPAKGIHRDGETFGGPAVRGGTYFMMVDGSIRMISDDVDPEVLKALSTPAGGD